MAKSSSKRKETAQATKQTKKQVAISRKEARQNRIILISIAILVAVVVLISAIGLIQELIVKPGKPVATVNGVKIRSDDYRDFLTYSRYNQYINIRNLQDSLDQLQASPEENEFLISFYEQQLSQLQSSLALLPESTLDELIDNELVRQKAEAEGLSVSADEVKETISGELRGILSPTAQEPLTDTEQLPTPTPVPQEQVDELYNTILDNMHLTDSSFRKIVQRNLLRDKVQELLASEVPTTGLVVDLQLIQTETEEEATLAKERIEGGEDFAIVAQEVSTDTVTAQDGGNLGWVTPSQLSSRYGEALEAVVLSSEVGKLALVESDGMYYVILVSDRDENGPLPAEVLNVEQNSALSDWLEKQKASPEVQIERLLEPDQIPPDPFVSTQSY
jgi:parvulin-like peptidyl-prolyl isomerase